MKMSKASRERERIRNEKYGQINISPDLKKKFDYLKRFDPDNFKILRNWTVMMSAFTAPEGMIVTSLPSGEVVQIGKNELNYLKEC